MANLTKTTVDAARPTPGKSQTLIWDDKLKGFGLRVMPNGMKAFVVEYRPKGSIQSKRLTLGRYDEAFTTDQARSRAKVLLGQARSGGDPIADIKAKKDKERAAKAEMTVNDLLDEFIEGYVKKNHKASTAVKELHSLKRYVRPYLGKLKLSALTTSTVKRWHTGLNTPVAANRALAYLRLACRFAIEHQWLTMNPCAGITRNTEKPKDRFLADDEIALIGAKLDAYEAQGELQASLGLGIRLLALTGLRKGEIRNLRWADFDPIKNTLRLRDAKTGTRTVALFPEASKLLRDAKRYGAYVVAGADPAEPVSDSTFTRAVAGVLSKAKVKDASAHTFRHTVATFMAQNGADAFAISHLGGWKTLSMVQRYVSMNSVGDKHPLPAGQRIAVALAGGNVVPLKVVA